MKNIKQWLKDFTHNCIIHPLLMFLPADIGTKIHNKHADWCWGKEHYGELDLEKEKKK